LDVVVTPPVAELAALAEAAVIDIGLDRVALRAGGEHVGDEALVPAAHLVVHAPAVVRAPVPVEDVVAVARVPVPLDLAPELVDAAAQQRLRRVGATEILARAEQAGEQVGGLDEVAAVVLAGEGDHAAAGAVEEVREDAVIAAGGLGQE